MFRIKICGINTVDDARSAAEAGADAVGFNFFPASVRYVDPRAAARIVECLPAHVSKVGLFVNSSVDEVLESCERLGLDWVQLHGDERPEFLAELGPRKLLRAFRVGGDGLRPVAAYLQECRRLACVPALCLLDSLQKDQYGGTGRVADWSVLAGYPLEPWHPPMVLAGGLTAENVGRAVEAVWPIAVDTASGVESSPGVKDPALVRRFVAAAREALNRAWPRDDGTKAT